MAAPFLSYHAAVAGLANMAAAISAAEKSLLITSSSFVSGLGRISVWKFMAPTWTERCCTNNLSGPER